MSDRLFALRLFARIAHTGSFSRAGRELDLSQPSASRIAADLEREVGAALLTRSTRGVTLTEAGADYLARIEPLLAALEEADHAARGTGELLPPVCEQLVGERAAAQALALPDRIVGVLYR